MRQMSTVLRFSCVQSTICSLTLTIGARVVVAWVALWLSAAIVATAPRGMIRKRKLDFSIGPILLIAVLIITVRALSFRMMSSFVSLVSSWAKSGFTPR